MSLSKSLVLQTTPVRKSESNSDLKKSKEKKSPKKKRKSKYTDFPKLSQKNKLSSEG